MQRVEAMRARLERIEKLDPETVLSGLPAEVFGHLGAPRFASRMAMRRARRLSGNDLFGPALDDREALLIEGSGDAIAALCHAVGSHIFWGDVLRIVRRDDVRALSDDLGVDAREAALRGRERDVGVAVPTSTEATLVEAIRHEGALSWACWLATREPASARRLRLLTPARVSRRVPRVIPDDAEMRERRRFVVDVELNAFVNAQRNPADEAEVA